MWKVVDKTMMKLIKMIIFGFQFLPTGFTYINYRRLERDNKVKYGDLLYSTILIHYSAVGHLKNF
jgi:hypothetical protein